MDTYDTFENLGSGVRLFDYTLDMRSIDHNGFLFDNLNFSNFGYGGDPNDVTRLRIEKNKWYDFRLLFRRDKNFWDYNLLANPLNPAGLNGPGSLIDRLLCGSAHGVHSHRALLHSVRTPQLRKTIHFIHSISSAACRITTSLCFPTLENSLPARLFP